MALAVTLRFHEEPLPVRKYGDSVLPGLSSRSIKLPATERLPLFLRLQNYMIFIKNRQRHEKEMLLHELSRIYLRLL